MLTSHIKIAARRSPLSQAQVEEIKELLRPHHPHVTFETTLVDTIGDIDLKTSLRSLDKTDFFTKEIDHLILNGICDAGIHSAKDLPDPIPNGLSIAAITKGVDPSDSLVLRPNESLSTLKHGALIATSSERREENVKKLRDDLKFIDIRGPIHQRLAKLDTGEADGVVIAEAALIRLKLTHLNRIRLPGETTPLQGQLAIIVKAGNNPLINLFSCIAQHQ